jgi:hypothetical protein
MLSFGPPPVPASFTSPGPPKNNQYGGSNSNTNNGFSMGANNNNNSDFGGYPNSKRKPIFEEGQDFNRSGSGGNPDGSNFGDGNQKMNIHSINVSQNPQAQKVKGDLVVLTDNIDKAEGMLRVGQVRDNKEFFELLANLTKMESKLADLAEKLTQFGECGLGDYAKECRRRINAVDGKYQAEINSKERMVDFMKPKGGDFGGFSIGPTNFDNNNTKTDDFPNFGGGNSNKNPPANFGYSADIYRPNAQPKNKPTSGSIWDSYPDAQTKINPPQPQKFDPFSKTPTPPTGNSGSMWGDFGQAPPQSQPQARPAPKND